MTLELQYSNNIKTVEVLGIESGPKPALIIRWGFGNYTLDLLSNQLVYIQGNRVNRKYPWKAVSIEAAWTLFRTFKEQKESVKM